MMRITERAFKWHVARGRTLWKKGKRDLAKREWGRTGYIRRELIKRKWIEIRERIKISLRKKCNFIAKASYIQAEGKRTHRNNYISEWSGVVVYPKGAPDSKLEWLIIEAIEKKPNYEYIARTYNKFNVVLKDCVSTDESEGVKKLKVDFFERL